MTPTRNVVPPDHPADLIERWEIEDSAKLAALREAARIGIADIEAGRFVEFGMAEALSTHLAALIATTLID
jgi:antitoxin ParD1/3/4